MHDKNANERVRGRREWESIPAQLTFIIEPVNAINTCTLVVPTKQKEICRVLDFVGEQEARALESLLATVHIISAREFARNMRRIMGSPNTHTRERGNSLQEDSHHIRTDARGRNIGLQITKS
jgi:hypothetical protein